MKLLTDADLDFIASAVAARLAPASPPAPQHGPALEPLGAILGVSPEAARQRETRAPALRALAVLVGRRRLYRRADVLQFG